MQRFGRPLISILGSKSGPIICAIVLIASLEGGSPARAQSVATRTTFTDSIKEPANVTVNGAVNKNAPTVVRSQLTDAEAQATIDFSIALKMRNFAELQQRVGVGEIIPLEEMGAKYFPVSSDVAGVRQWLTAQGFEVLPPAGYELSVFARGTVAQLQRVFGVTFARVQFRREEHTSAVTAPSLPADVAGPVLSINGLQPHLHPFSHAVRKAAAPAKSIQNQPPYLVSEIDGAYDMSSGNGTGQKIGIVIDTFPKNSDLTSFWADNGVPQSLSNIEKVQVVAGTLPSPEGEETLDVSWSSGVAPAAKIRVYATTDLAFTHLDRAYQFIINELSGQPTLHQLSMSFGLGEFYESPGQMQTDSQYFATIAGRGVTIFVSSGDGGSNPDTNGNFGGPVQVESPANDPSVTAVGGTSLTLNSNGTVSSETVWFDGSGGGQSTVFSRPAWQPGSGTISGNGRLVPDVALDADPNTGVFLILNGSAGQWGGTSLSAPVWAGLCARINQIRAGHGSSSLGLLGPNIYPLLGTFSFRDIITGSNGAYNAGPGFDLCTGVGVPDVNVLIATLGNPLTPGTGVADDFNNDGKADLLLENSATGKRAIWYLSDGIFLSSSALPTLDPQWHIAGSTDFLGNGQASLILENTSTGQHLVWILSNGFYVSTIALPTIPNQWHISGIAGVAFNSRKNIVLENTDTGRHVVWVLDNGAYSFTIALPTVGPQWHITGVADAPTNDQAHVILENTVTGHHVLWVLNNGTYSFTLALPAVSPQWRVAAVADFLGNDQADIVLENTVTGHHVLWVLNNGSYSFTIALPTVGTRWKVAGAADFLGNGQAGIALQNIVTGQRNIWILNNGAYAYTTVLPTVSTQWQIQER